MIAKLTGVVDEIGDGWVVIDVGGVGYLVFCSSRTLSRIPARGGTASLTVETHVREDHIQLYGFESIAERDWFRLLNTVQGVGVRVALGILSTLSADQLAQAIAAKDSTALSGAPGVGKKLAARLVTELADKIGGIVFGSPMAPVPSGPVPEGDGATADAVSALVNLGYGRSEAFGAVARARGRLGTEAPVETLIRDGLAELGGEARP